MSGSKTSSRALARINYDLFEPENIAPPAPATLYTSIREHAQATVSREEVTPPDDGLPSVAELYRMFDQFNLIYFGGKLPPTVIEYSTRMRSAGSYTPGRRLIRIGRKYHELFPGEISDTLKHEMIHIVHFRHNAAFKAEAARIGASLKARPHPDLLRPPKYIYFCPECGREYPRQRRLRMASCGYCTKGKSFDSRYKLRLREACRK